MLFILINKILAPPYILCMGQMVHLPHPISSPVSINYK